MKLVVPLSSQSKLQFIFPFAFGMLTIASSVSFAAEKFARDSTAIAVAEQIKNMTLRQKIGQLLMIGFNGVSLDESLKDTLPAVQPGGLIVFGRNITSAQQISDLLFRAQQISEKNVHVPLLVSTDQEGGSVIRLKTANPLPSALAIGRSGDPSLAEKAGFATARLMKALGFNMNLAPVLDVADPHRMSFIGTRSYGEEPNLVADMGTAFSSGLIRGGVLPTGKHFPGQGSLAQDPHSERAEKNVSLDEMMKLDLLPFTKINNSLGDRWAIMVGHIACPEIDPSGTAAVYSKPILTDVLRDTIGFNGLVLTDDIQMEGAGELKDPRERAVRAIESGADMIMVAWNRRLQRELVNSIERAVQSGRLRAARIEESVGRILRVKMIYAAGPPVLHTRSEMKLALENSAFSEIATAAMVAQFRRPLDSDEMQLRQATLVKSGQEPKSHPIFVFSANQRFALSFKLAAEKNRRVGTFGIDYLHPEAVNRTMLSNPRAFGVFYVSGAQAERAAAHIAPDVARRMLLVSTETPGSLVNARDFNYIAETYFRHPELGKMIAERYFNQKPTVTTEVRRPTQVKNTRGG